MAKLLSTRQTIKGLRSHAKIGNAEINVDKKFLRMLNETGRLFPVKSSILGKKYDLETLKEYAHDVAPR